MPRPRQRTECIGLMATKAEAQLIKAYARGRRISVSEYLRESAIRPLMDAAAPNAEGEVGDGQQD
jgi:hypothetical protein